MTVVSCPHCDAKLKLARPIPNGKCVRCAKCRGIFPAPTAEEEVAEEDLTDFELAIAQGQTPSAREYFHEKCGQATEVSAEDFSRIVNPFSFVPQTFCAGCQKYVSLKAVKWIETGESITAFRRRLRAVAPISLKLFGWIFGPLLFFLIGAGIGWLFTPNDIKGPLSGGIVGPFFFIFLIPAFSRWVWKIDYRLVK